MQICVNFGSISYLLTYLTTWQNFTLERLKMIIKNNLKNCAIDCTKWKKIHAKCYFFLINPFIYHNFGQVKYLSDIKRSCVCVCVGGFKLINRLLR